MRLFLTTGAVNKDIKNKKKFADDSGYNISRLFDVLPNIAFTTNETRHDYY